MSMASLAGRFCGAKTSKPSEGGLEGMQTLHTPGDHAVEVIRRFLTLPDEAFYTADVFVADWKVRLRSTSVETTNLYSQRLCRRDAVAPESGGRLTLTLLETNALGWPQTDASWRSQTGRFRYIMSSWGLQGLCPDAVESWTMFDPKQGIGTELVESIGHLPPWHTGAPFRILLHLAAVNRGWSLVHAATLADGDEGVLIVGPGKAGKSGTTLAGISSGLKTAGDDYVLVCPGNPPTAFRAYNVMKQDRRGLARIRGLTQATAHLETNWQDKLEFDPEELFPGCMIESVRLRAILTPKIAHAPNTEFLSVDPQSVFRQFFPSLWAQLPVARAAGFKFAASLTRSLPTFTMLLSDEPAEIAGSIRQFIARLER
jgi:hypothetical protein